MKFALIGGGVVGRCYGEALVQQGHAMRGVWDLQPTPELRALASATGAEVFVDAGPWIAEVDVVLSAVFGTAALDVARRALPHMRPGGLYIDMTTATPEDMASGASEARRHGVAFVDVAITGAVNLRGARTPLLCAGDEADRVLACFAGLGAPIRVVGHRPGQAVQLKLLRSIFAKGLEALAIECLTTAEAAGLRAELHEVLLDIDQTSLQSVMEAMVSTHIEHAHRRRSEVIEAAQLMRAVGIQPLLLDQVQVLFERTVEAVALRAAPERSLDAALQWLIQTAAHERATPINTPAGAPAAAP